MGTLFGPFSPRTARFRALDARSGNFGNHHVIHLLFRRATVFSHGENHPSLKTPLTGPGRSHRGKVPQEHRLQAFPAAGMTGFQKKMMFHQETGRLVRTRIHGEYHHP